MSSDVQSVILVVLALAFLLGIAIQVVFLRSLQMLIARCAPRNRALSPGQVWLNLVPFFNFVWQFILISRVSETLSREFAARQIPPDSRQGDFGKAVGMSMCGLYLASVIPFVGIVTGFAGFVCWIVYWTRITGYARQLDAGQPRPPSEPYVAPDPAAAWPILLLLIFAFGAAYLQRVALSAVFNTMRHDLQLSTVEVGWVFSSFLYGLLAGYIVMSLVTTLCGARWGLFVALLGASLMAAASASASTFMGLVLTRGMLGVFSGGLLPASVQAVREWFPARMRPFAIGLVLASAQVSVLLMPLLPNDALPWRTLLMITGVPTAIAAALCLVLWPARTPRDPSGDLSGSAILSTALLAAGLFLVIPIFQFVTTWLPQMSQRILGTAAADVKSFAWVFPVAGLLGAVLSGAIAWVMMSGGFPPARTRATLLTVFGLLLPLAAVAAYVSEWSLVVVFAALCSIAFQAWSTLLYAAVADTVPPSGVAVAVAIGALVGGLSQLLTQTTLVQINPLNDRALTAIGLAVLAVIALLGVALPAWLVRPAGQAA
jgi:ACS family hexuronate transporter-like MFS transporter